MVTRCKLMTIVERAGMQCSSHCILIFEALRLKSVSSAAQIPAPGVRVYLVLTRTVRSSKLCQGQFFLMGWAGVRGRVVHKNMFADLS